MDHPVLVSHREGAHDFDSGIQERPAGQWHGLHFIAQGLPPDVFGHDVEVVAELFEHIHRRDPGVR